MSPSHMTGAEQARFQPPPCPKCGGTDVEVHWQDCTSSRDDERHYAPAMFECRTCAAGRAVSGLDEFLLARIAEDEQLIERGRASAALDRCFTPNRIAVMPIDDGGWEVVVDFERVLAECEAKRRIIEAAWVDHLQIEDEWGVGHSRERMIEDNDYPHVVRLLALPYADHPDYREEWRPSSEERTWP